MSNFFIYLTKTIRKPLEFLSFECRFRCMQLSGQLKDEIEEKAFPL